MRLGIFAKIFSRSTVEEVFDSVAAYGLDCVQFNFASAGLPGLPDRIDPAILERIGRAARARKISIAALSGTFNMIHPDPEARRDGLKRLEIIAPACAGLGTNLLTLCTGTRDPENMWRDHPGNKTPEAWRDLLASLTEALAVAERHDLRLGIEPETGNVINSARQARRLLDELRSPRLRIILDAANLFHPGQLPRVKQILDEAFDLLGGEIILAHAKELGRDGQPGGLPPGAGALDWGHYLARLRQAGFDGPLILHGFEERDTAGSVSFLRKEMAACESKR